MEMFYTSLKPILFHHNDRSNQNSDFELSHSLESIINQLEDNEPSRVVIYGEPGCGRTTLLHKICNKLLESRLTNNEIFGLRVRAGCSVQSLWNFLSEISKERQDKDTASLLLQSSAKLSKKYRAGQAFISSNFKLICIDDVYSDDGMVWSHLSRVLHEIKAHVVVVCTRNEVPLLQATLTLEQIVLSVELKGICMDSFKKCLDHKLPEWTLSDEEELRTFKTLNGNPTSLKIIVNAVDEFKLPPEILNCSYLLCSEHHEQECCSVLKVIQFLLEHLTAFEKEVFSQLCQLREALPMTTVKEEIEKLVRLGLVNKEFFDVDTGTNEVIYSISVASCIQLSLLQLTCASDINGDCSDGMAHFSVFDAWYALLSEKLHQLISDAQGNAWPFVPEKW